MQGLTRHELRSNGSFGLKPHNLREVCGLWLTW